MGAVRRTVARGAIVLLSATGCGTFTDPPVSEPPRALIPRARSASGLPIPQPPPSLLNGPGPLADGTPRAEPTDVPLPINLATALQLANARPLDVQIAGKQVSVAVAQYDRARLLWVPNLVMGTDYFLHTGPQQSFSGAIISSDRNTLMAGLGPSVLFAFSDAVYAPLAARQGLRARQADQQTALNDTTLAVMDAYFAVQQARGELAGATTAVKHANDVVRKTTAALAKGYAPPSEVNRANTELGRRKQLVAASRERWRTASAELARLLRLDPSAVLEPVEPPFLPVTVIDPTVTVDGLIPIALSTRPELSGHQAVIQATLARLKQEKLRPLVPSLALRSASTNPAGSLGYGVFGGGPSGSLRDFGGRLDVDVQLLWEFQALGFGNRARVQERRAEYEAATLELFRTQDRVAAEVVSAFAQVRAAAERVNAAEPALREAVDLVNRTVEEFGQTRRLGDSLTLLIRPQEAVAAVQAFAQASADFFGSVADYNRAQFRLYRALGHPAQCLASAMPLAVDTLPDPEERSAQPPATPIVSTTESPRTPGVSVYPPGNLVPSVVPVGVPVPPQTTTWTPAAIDSMPPRLPLRPPVIVPEREP